MGIGVAERAQAVVVFLACSIPQSELDVFAIYLDICHIVLEDRRDINLESEDEKSWKSESSVVYLWECAFGKDNQETGLREIRARHGCLRGRSIPFHKHHHRR